MCKALVVRYITERLYGFTIELKHLFYLLQCFYRFHTLNFSTPFLHFQPISVRVLQCTAIILVMWHYFMSISRGFWSLWKNIVKKILTASHMNIQSDIGFHNFLSIRAIDHDLLYGNVSFISEICGILDSSCFSWIFVHIGLPVLGKFSSIDAAYVGDL